jgi:hypothetical protein
MTGIETLMTRLETFAYLVVVVVLGCVSMVALDERMQGSLRIFVGSICFALAVGIISIVAGVPVFWVLILGIGGLISAVPTIAWASNKTLFDLIDEIRRFDVRPSAPPVPPIPPAPIVPPTEIEDEENE